MNPVPEWITAIMNIIIAGGVVIAILQLFQHKTQMKNDHEKGRREKAVDLLIHFDNCLHRETSMARKLMEKLSEEQLRKIYHQEEVEIEPIHRHLVEGALSGRYDLGDNKGIDVAVTLVAP